MNGEARYPALTTGASTYALAPARTRAQLAVETFSERRWVPLILALSSATALELSVLLGWLTRVSLSPLFGKSIEVSQLHTIGLVVLVLPLIQLARGFFPGYGTHPATRLRDWTYTILAFFASLAIWDYLVLEGRWSRGLLIFTACYALPAVPLAEILTRKLLIRKRFWGTPAIVLGAGNTGTAVVKTLKAYPAIGLVPVALFDDDPEKQGSSVDGIPVLGPLQASNQLVGTARLAIVTMPGAGRQRLAEILAELKFPRVIVVPDLAGMQSLWIRPLDMAGLLGLELRRNLLLRRNILLKRTLDYALAIPLAILAAPCIALFALYIRAVSPGSPFFTQEREGYLGQPLRIWKLRTMYPDAEQRLYRFLAQNPTARDEWERYFKLKNDPRVLPGIGRFLRKTSLDELPQLWNVLKGQMSLVGPRPFPYYHVERFPPEFRALRQKVLPGLTGLWQVSARSDGDLQVQQALDTYYITNWSPWFDLYLLAKTAYVVLRGKGAY